MKPIQMAGPWITDLEKKTVLDMMENGWDNYEYVEDISTLKTKDKIRYLSKTHFYDIKVSPHVSYICNNNKYITVANGVYHSSVKDNVLIFKYIPDSTLVKMKLMELIQD